MSVDAGFSPWTMGFSRWPSFWIFFHRLKRLQSYMSTVRKQLSHLQRGNSQKSNMFQQNLKTPLPSDKLAYSRLEAQYSNLSKYHQNCGFSNAMLIYWSIFLLVPMFRWTVFHLEISVMRWDHLREGCQWPCGSWEGDEKTQGLEEKSNLHQVGFKSDCGFRFASSWHQG